MKKRVNDILRGKFLVDEDALRNWRMIIFLSVLALIMIGSSHKADEKVYEIARLKEEVQELRSEHIDAHLTVRKLQMESNVARLLFNSGIVPSTIPPKKIKVTSKTR